MDTMKNRVNRLRAVLKARQLSCLIITNPANVTYTTGFSGDDSWAIITGRKTYLLTDSRYIEQARRQCPLSKIVERTGTLPAAAAEIIARSKSLKTAAVENCTSIAVYNSLKENIKIRLRHSEGLVEQLRTIKDPAETAAIATAGRIALQALKRGFRYAKAGTTENELAGRIELEVRRLGAINSFPTIVAFGSNASRPHHQSGNRKLRKNDTILIDWGVRYKNYCSDLTRCFAIGKVRPFYTKVYNAVIQAQQAAINAVRAGVDIQQVDRAARKVLSESKLPVYGHGTGHGIGLEVHEVPIVAPKSKGKLISGQVITIEPGVYIPGKVGIRIEDDVLVAQTGCRILNSIVTI